MDAQVKRLCDFIRQTAFEIHCYLRHGHLEKVYENALAHRLQKAGLTAIQQHPLNVHDEDGTLLGNFAADLFVEGIIVVELKAARALSDAHAAQLLGYLRAARLEHGHLCNFGAPRFEIRKYALSSAADLRFLRLLWLEISAHALLARQTGTGRLRLRAVYPG